MAITKIHPIKFTLHLAIAYITEDKKTDEQILISSYKCNASTAHIQFLRTREDNDVNGTVLARHLIQSFLPNEVTPEKAHKIGLELCKTILKDEYEFVLSTHIDKGHIHNHVIFNNVNMITGKCYKSNKKSYHQIRYQSDKLCQKYKLSIIDESYEIYKRKYKAKGKSWYENEQVKKGNSWKGKLQFDIDRIIKQAKDWEDFLKRMSELGYEIKYGKHISFKHKDKTRFTRAKAIGEDYTEEKLKERIEKNNSRKAYTVKKRVGNVIDISTNSKIKSSKSYEFWATKYNLKTMADSIILMRERGFNSITELDEFIRKSAENRQDIQDKIKVIDTQMSVLSQTMEQVNIINKYREIYKYHKKNPYDKQFESEYLSQLTLYKTSATELLKTYKKCPKSGDILGQLDELNEKRNILMDEYSIAKSDMNELFQIRKNYETYMDKGMER